MTVMPAIWGISLLVGLILAYGWAWVDVMVGSWAGWAVLVVILAATLALGVRYA